MSNAAKHRKKAAEFEQLKQIDRAIASYVRAIEESEAEGEDVDVALLNKVGDLALRQGRVPDAVTYYERAVEHYATAGLFNNAIALCNKILRNAPGRSNVYFTLGRICARKGLRGDATRNFLEYAARMQQEGRVEEAMRALGEVADLMPELTEVRRLVDEHAERAGVTLPRRRTPQAVATVEAPEGARFPGDKSSNLVFLEVDYGAANARLTPPIARQVADPIDAPAAPRERAPTPVASSPLPFIDLDGAPARVATVAAQPAPSAALPLPALDPAPPSASPSATLATTELSAWPEMVLLDAVESEETESHTGCTTNDADSPALSADDLDFVIAPIEPEAMFLELPVLDLVDNVSLLENDPLTPSWDAEQPSLRETERMDFPLDELDTESLAHDAAFGMELVAFDLVDEQEDEQGEEHRDELVDEQIFEAVAEPANEMVARQGDEEDERNAEAIEQSIRFEIERMESEFAAEHQHAVRPVGSLGAAVAEAPSVVPEAAATTNDPASSETVAVAPDDAADIDKPDEEAPVTSGLATPTSSRSLLAPAPMLAIDAAIAAGAERALREAEADPVAVQRRPPYRLDPHDFILPGELPPLLVSEELVDAGLERANTPLSARAVVDADVPPESSTELTTVDEPSATSLAQFSIPPSSAEDRADGDFAAGEPGADVGTGAEATAKAEVESAPTSAPESLLDQATAVHASAEFGEIVGDEAESSVESARSPSEPVRLTAIEEVAEIEAVAAAYAELPDAPIIAMIDEHQGDRAADALDELSAVSLTPSLPIAAVAAEANVVAVSRRDELRTLVAERPQDWALRRRLAEALFEAGQRDAALAELEASLTGFVQSGEIALAADVSEMLVGVSPERVSYHQKRVELAVRLKDEQRLRFAYLDLADTLVRNGEEARAQAVYARVLEIDPLDDRARAALGSAAPPPPAPTSPEPPAEGFVNLADWLRDDEAPVSTRMRMREPTVSGDEDADFASLLRHFKEGVSRSLGEEDFESRYDLGVAYKEMGLLDDAVAEFQKALRSRTHRLPAYEALGQCFVEQGRYQVAATVLSRALHEPGLNDEQRVGVLYLLAYSCEALQRWGEARSYFQRVYATDINFRDVAARLAALEHVAS